MRRILLTMAIVLFAVATPGFADKVSPDSVDPNNVGPPGGAVLDLAGSAINAGVWTNYTVNFVAAGTLTNIAFLFRNDPGYTAVDDTSVVDTTAGTGNQFANPGFEAGTVGGAPVGWNFENIYGAGFAGFVDNGTCNGAGAARTGSNQWCDGATQAYDAIDQNITTVIGDTYQISFWQNFVDVTGFAGPDYQQLSTNSCQSDQGCANGTDGNGIDTLVYVGSHIPNPVPEPGSMLLLASAALGLGYKFRSKFAR